MNVLTRFVHAARGWHRPLVLHAVLMFGLAVLSAVGVFADDRLLLGAIGRLDLAGAGPVNCTCCPS
jgi:hypothetical protein